MSGSDRCTSTATWTTFSFAQNSFLLLRTEHARQCWEWTCLSLPSSSDAGDSPTICICTALSNPWGASPKGKAGMARGTESFFKKCPPTSPPCWRGMKPLFPCPFFVCVVSLSLKGHRQRPPCEGSLRWLWVGSVGETSFSFAGPSGVKKSQGPDGCRKLEARRKEEGAGTIARQTANEGSARGTDTKALRRNSQSSRLHQTAFWAARGPLHFRKDAKTRKGHLLTRIRRLRGHMHI